MKKLTVLVACMNAVGHINAAAGALSKLVARGHRVIFVVEKAFEGKLSPLGYDEVIWSNPPVELSTNSDNEPEKSTQNPGERMAQFLYSGKIIGPFSPLEKLENLMEFFYNPAQRIEYKLFNATVKQAIEDAKPDVVYIDGSLPPAVYYSGLPWIKQISTAPLFFINEPRLPPGGSGLPEDDSSDWHLYDKLNNERMQSPKFAEIVEDLGYERYPSGEVLPETQILTVHAYPEELNYDVIRSKGWFNLEVFNKTPSSDRVNLSKLIPDHFLNDDLNGKFSGKLIYVSMGSMGSVDLELMSRLLNAFAKTNHKFIVSKGPRHAEFELPPNAWGDRYLPQTGIIPHVDLVITHGGNNTVTETFAEGKPMIVLPMFADQFDNGQRFHETRLGAKIEPYNFTEEQLISTIDRLLDDIELAQKLQKASLRIHSTDKHNELADKIEQLLAD